MRRLPGDTQQILAIVAADNGGQLAPVFRAAVALGIDPSALDAAETSGLVTIRGASLGFRHLLVARRSPRAWHLVSCGRPISLSRQRSLARTSLIAELGTGQRRLSVQTPNLPTSSRARLAPRCDAAARRRGKCLERAAFLTQDKAIGARRLLEAATAAWRAGQPSRANALLDQARPNVDDPQLKIQLGHLAGVIGFGSRSILDAGATLMAAASEATRFSSRRWLEILFDAGLSGVDAGDYGLVGDVGRRAAEIRAAPIPRSSS